MKIKLILLLIFSIGLNAKYISTQEVVKNLDNPKYLFIDTRNDSFYNGFKQKGAIRGGHIKNALQITIESLEFKDKTLVFYDSDEDRLEQVSAEFKAYGYKVKIYKDIIKYSNDEKNPLEKFKNYTFSVSPSWLYQAINGKKVESYDGKDIMVFEVSWGNLKKAKTTHIKGAYHFNTDWIENAPIWNLSEPKVIEKNLLKAGITKDKLIVLYSQNQMAALRVFWALKWAGVKDVRFLNGGLYSWLMKDFPVENKVNIPKEEKDFGSKIPKAKRRLKTYK